MPLEGPKEAMLYAPLEDGKVHCRLCHHHCRIASGKAGFCGVRRNEGGRLVTDAYGRVIAANVDPIEKKPLYHFLPGTTAFSIATAGCNFRCGFCQNWHISQTTGRGPGLSGPAMTPAQIVDAAVTHGCRSVAYTYTEPTIFFEYAFDTAKEARARGLRNVFVTNGFMTREALDAARPVLDACNVDLKAFRDAFYRKVCRGRLSPVLDTIRHLKVLGIWTEITTLVIPGKNDDPSELQDIARFIAETDPDMPWHISRFHPDYRYTDIGPTPVATLERAAAAGRAEGLHHIYVGNVPGAKRDTLCHRCGETVIRRGGVRGEIILPSGGLCPACGQPVAGVFS